MIVQCFANTSLSALKHSFIYNNLYILHWFAPTSGLYYKQVTVVIYDSNDIGLYYKTRDDRNWWS
jgi:hypothetical protein